MRFRNPNASTAPVEQIDALADEWDALADRVDAEPWHRPGWHRAWWLAFGEEPYAVRTVRRDGRLVALAPVMRTRAGWRAPTNWHTPTYSLLAEDDAARAELSEQLLAAHPASLTLPFLDPEEVPALDAAADAHRYRPLVRTHVRSPYVPTDGPIESLWETDIDTRKSPRELARRRKKLDGAGKAEFVVADGSENLDELLVEAFRVESSGWKADLGTAIISRPDTLQFYTDVAHWAADRGILRLFHFRLDDRMVACEMCFEDNDRVSIIKGGIDPDFKKYAVGVLTHYEITKYCFDNGLQSLEWLGDEAPHKREWTSKSRERMVVQLFRPDPVGAAGYAAYAYGRPLAKRALELKRR